jgi:SIR2-like protein
MLMIIFGAGASYDAIPSRPAPSYLADRLPLANELFADRPNFMHWTDQFPQCKPIIPRLQHVPEGATVESVLERLQAEESQYPERRRQLTAIRFYLQCMIYFTEHAWTGIGRDITNYKTLFDDILCWRKEATLVVTFNYDLMIETALRAFDVHINSLPDYISDQRFKLIKLHGSVNWVRQVVNPIIDLQNRTQENVAQELIERAAEIKYGPYHNVVGNPPHGYVDYRQGGAPAICAAYPALAIPVEIKKDFDCPKEHLQALEHFIPQVTKILVIGWRGAEKAFRELLEKLPEEPPVMVVSPGEVDETIAKMREVTRLTKARFQSLNSTFTDFIVNRRGEAFLKGK